MKDEKLAVYSGTRNLYPHMVTASKSLIANSAVEKVVLLIEDESFPYEIPDMIETIDVHDQQWFHPRSANIKTQFSYMSLLRVCYTKLLDADRVLQLDVDTVVVDDIDALWELDMGSAWFAAVREPARYVTDRSGDKHRIDWKPWGEAYFNIGVTLFNLKQIKADGQDDWLIHVLNTEKLNWIDQDAWNKYHRNRYIDLDRRYNESMVTGYTDRPAIVHFAGYGNGWLDPGFTECPRLEHLRKYREMGWDEVMDRHAEHTVKTPK